MSSWLRKCKRFTERWTRRLKERQSNNYKWLKDWRKKSTSYLWSQYFNQALFFSETWSFLIQKLSYMFSMISFSSQTFRKYHAETISSLEVQKFQSWAMKMWLYEQQKKFYDSRMWSSAWTLSSISSHFLFSKRKTSIKIQSTTFYFIKAIIQ